MKIADVLRENNEFVYTTDQNDETTWPGIRIHLSSVTNIKNVHARYSSVGRALCLEYRVSWVRVPPQAARKSDCLGCAVLLCLVCLFDLACFFLFSFSSLI